MIAAAAASATGGLGNNYKYIGVDLSVEVCHS